MKNEQESVIPGILFLAAGIIQILSVDFDDYDWIDILPTILFSIAGLWWIFDVFKRRKIKGPKNGKRKY